MIDIVELSSHRTGTAALGRRNETSTESHPAKPVLLGKVVEQMPVEIGAIVKRLGRTRERHHHVGDITAPASREVFHPAER